MKKYLFPLVLFFCLSGASLYSKNPPPLEIPPDLYNAYTLDGQIPVLAAYRDDSQSEEYTYSKSQIDLLILKAKAVESWYYGITDQFLYQALNKFSNYISARQVAILGSTIPWYESIILANGGHPVTIEYNKIKTDDTRLQILTVDQYRLRPQKFDCLLSISSFEHDGLGRYGDPIHPNGDLIAMNKCREMLTENGILILAVPVGKDCLVWNCHRIYGKIRLELLLKGWEVVDSFGFSPEDFNSLLGGFLQPVFVLKPSKK